jgi:hypothetical protein
MKARGRAPNGGSVRVAQIRGLITQRDEDPSHIKEPADQAPARSSGLGYKLAPNIRSALMGCRRLPGAALD